MRAEEDIIRKNTSIAKASEILELHGVDLPKGWEIALAMLLTGYDYLEVHGFGYDAYFSRIKEFKEE